MADNTPRMFFDDLVERYSGGVKRYSQQSLEGEACFNNLRLLGETKLFLINGAVVDDLYNLSHDAAQYEAAMHLPFPNVFFELMDSLEVRIDKIHARDIRGMLFGRSRDLFHDGLTQALCPEDRYEAHLFSQHTCTKEGEFIPDVVYFDLSRLPTFNFRFGPFEYKYEPGMGVQDAYQGVVDSVTVVQGDRLLTDATTQTQRESIMTNFGRLLDLCINIVDYINAHNVIINRTDREKRNMATINRRRRKHGKAPIFPLKPYHWIDVRQQIVHPHRSDEESSMAYREWVRGHFQRYHTTEGRVKNWIMPYIRGPDDAPWKENRYRVLDNMFRQGPRYKT